MSASNSGHSDHDGDAVSTELLSVRQYRALAAGIRSRFPSPLTRGRQRVPESCRVHQAATAPEQRLS